ncbi:unnamed protein product, partial [Lymnaea stagnalis]
MSSDNGSEQLKENKIPKAVSTIRNSGETRYVQGVARIPSDNLSRSPKPNRTSLRRHRDGAERHSSESDDGMPRNIHHHVRFANSSRDLEASRDDTNKNASRVIDTIDEKKPTSREKKMQKFGVGKEDVELDISDEDEDENYDQFQTPPSTPSQQIFQRHQFKVQDNGSSQLASEPSHVDCTKEQSESASEVPASEEFQRAGSEGRESSSGSDQTYEDAKETQPTNLQLPASPRY